MNSYTWTLTKKQAPVWTHEPYVTTGYRESTGSYWECIKSMFAIHNQTVNIWTSVALVLYNLITGIQMASTKGMPSDIQLFFLIHGGLRAYCWITSWGFHTFSCHSLQVSSSWCSLDYIGCYLTPLCMGSNLIYIEFYCHSYWKTAIIIIGLITTSISIWISTDIRYTTEKWRTMRMIGSICNALPWLIGLISAIPIVHHGIVPNHYKYLGYALGVECIAGGFYISMIPEYIISQVFDIVLSSHSLWHLLNFGFDWMMFTCAYKAYLELSTNGNRCGC
jgi:adiponectin receptor